MTTRAWDPKYPTDVDIFTADWTDVLDGDELAAPPTAVAMGLHPATVDSIDTVGVISKLRISGGQPCDNSRIVLRGVTTTGRDVRSVVWLPIIRP